MSIYKRCFLLGAALLLCVLSEYSYAQEGDSAPIERAFLELYKHEDKNIALGAMLVSVTLWHTSSLEKYIRCSMEKSATPLEKVIKLYTLSMFTSDYTDMKNFIVSFPERRDDFIALVMFESSITRHPHSKMITYLASFATVDVGDAAEEAPLSQHDRELKDLAQQKMAAITPLADGWLAESIIFLLEQK